MDETRKNTSGQAAALTPITERPGKSGNKQDSNRERIRQIAERAEGLLTAFESREAELKAFFNDTISFIMEQENELMQLRKD